MHRVESPPQQLKKAVGASQFFTIGFGAIVGVGWIVVLGDWLNQAGPLGAILAFLAGGLLITLIGLCYAELATMLPVSGGEMPFAYEIFGLKAAFVIGWAVILFLAIVVSYVAISAAWITDYLIPGVKGPTLYTFRGGDIYLGSLIIALAGIGLLTWANYRGVQSSTTVQDVSTYGKIVVAIVFIAAGILGGSAENLQPLVQRSASGSMWTGIIAVTATTMWFYGGFNFVPQVLEEKAPDTPLNQVGRVMLLSIFVSIAFYCLVILSASMAVPWQSLVDAELPAAAAFRQAFGSPWLANLVLIAGLLGTITVGNACFLAGTRLLFALSRARIIPPVFDRVHPVFRSPVNAVMFIGISSALAVFLGREAIVPIINVGTICLSLGYLITCLGVIALRRREPQRARPYKVPGGIVTAAIASAVTLFLIISALYQPYQAAGGKFPLEWGVMVTWIALGFLLWVLARNDRERISEQERRQLMFGGAAPEARVAVELEATTTR